MFNHIRHLVNDLAKNQANFIKSGYSKSYYYEDNAQQIQIILLSEKLFHN